MDFASQTPPNLPLQLRARPSSNRISALFEALAEIDLVQWLRAHGKALVVTDDEGLDALAPHHVPQRLCHWSNERGIQAYRHPEFTALSLEREEEIANAIRRLRPESIVHRFFGTVVPARALGAPAGAPVAAAELTYAIVCPPRSGSEYLCSLLASNRVGNPRELLRPYLCTLVTEWYGCGEDPLGPLRARFANARRGPVFGTKIILQFLRRYLTGVGALDAPEVLHELTALFDKWILLVRRDAVAQAVSTYLAEQTAMWHIRDKHDDRARADIRRAREAVPFDAEAIGAYLSEIYAIERWGWELITGVQPERIYCLAYEDLVEEPGLHLARLLDWLHAPPPDPAALHLSAGVERFVDAAGEAMASRFRAAGAFPAGGRAALPRSSVSRVAGLDE